MSIIRYIFSSPISLNGIGIVITRPDACELVVEPFAFRDFPAAFYAGLLKELQEAGLPFVMVVDLVFQLEILLVQKRIAVEHEKSLPVGDLPPLGGQCTIDLKTGYIDVIAGELPPDELGQLSRPDIPVEIQLA